MDAQIKEWSVAHDVESLRLIRGPDSRTHRLRVAVSSLRKRVLGDMLVREEGAYRLEATSLSMSPAARVAPPAGT